MPKAQCRRVRGGARRPSTVQCSVHVYTLHMYSALYSACTLCMYIAQCICTVCTVHVHCEMHCTVYMCKYTVQIQNGHLWPFWVQIDPESGVWGHFGSIFEPNGTVVKWVIYVGISQFWLKMDPNLDWIQTQCLIFGPKWDPKWVIFLGSFWKVHFGSFWVHFWIKMTLGRGGSFWAQKWVKMEDLYFDPFLNHFRGPKTDL